LREIECGIVDDTRADDVDGVKHQASSGRVGFGDGHIGHAGLAEQPAGFGGRHVVDSDAAPEVEPLIDAVIDAEHFLAAVEYVLDREKARRGGRCRGAVL
jgi:hypothetical protein